MLSLLRFWPQQLLGLDIQAGEIRLLRLQGFRKKKQVKQALTFDLPIGAVKEGEIQEAEVVSNCLQKLAQDNGLKGWGVAVALPAQCVQIKSISVIKGLHESELESEVVSHLGDCFPGVPEGLCYDYIVLPPHDDMHSNLLLVATSFVYLNNYLTVVRNAGLELRIVDTEEYALARAKRYIEQENLLLEDRWLISCGLALRSYDL